MTGSVVTVGLAAAGWLAAQQLDPGPVARWLDHVVRPRAGSAPTIGRPDIWAVPALELLGVALIGGRAVAVRGERRVWVLVGASAFLVTVAHLLYRLLLPQAPAGGFPLTARQLGLAVHLIQTLFFVGIFLAVSLLATKRVGVPTLGVRLDGLIGGCGVLTLGTAFLVPDATLTAARGWAEVGTVLLGVSALAPVALLVGLLPLLGRAPTRAWWSMTIGVTLAMVAAASTLVRVALGADALSSLGWLWWPASLLALAWTAWHVGPPTTATGARPTRGITPTAFALGAVAVLVLDRVVPQPPVVLVLAFVTILMSVARMTFALRSANRLGIQHQAQRQRLREARDEALAASQARTQFAATLSHEIRTPLHAVIGMSELLMASDLDPVQKGQIGHVRRSGMLILDLVHDVLERATIDADELTLDYKPMELAEVLGDVVELLQVGADAKGVQLSADLDPACPDWVSGDATRLRQVLLNLVGNAVKFTDSGEVTLEVCPAARLEQPTAVYFQVTDTGTGIPASELDRVFQPYTRVLDPVSDRRVGTGLGLSISQALVHRMGGEITVTSQERVGSVFGFELVLPAEPVPAEVAVALQGRHISVVDSQPARAASFAGLLRQWGAGVSVGRPGPSVPQPGAQSSGLEGDHGWWSDHADTVVVREDHPDALAHLVADLRRHGGRRPTLMIITASGHAIPADGLGPTDAVVPATTTRSRLRSGLVAIGPQTVAAHPSAAHDERPLRVLLAEDDPTSQLVGQLMVQRLGHQIDVVGDGAAAVAAAASTAYDLILMDSQMPELDGVDATRAIRRGEPAGERVPVIALTGALTDPDRRSYTDAGMDGVLAKPLGRTDLAELLAGTPRRTAVRLATTVPA